MSTRLFTITDVAERTGFSVRALKKAIRQDYAPGQDRLPRLGAKRGRRNANGYQYLIPEDALAEFIDALPDA